MSEFDKIFPRETLTSISDQQIVDDWRQKRREGWIAALKWVLSLKDECRDEYGNMKIYIDPVCIEEELKEDKT